MTKKHHYKICPSNKHEWEKLPSRTSWLCRNLDPYFHACYLCGLVKLTHDDKPLEISEHRFILLDTGEKEIFMVLFVGRMDIVARSFRLLASALYKVCSWINRHYGRKPSHTNDEWRELFDNLTTEYPNG